MKLTKENLPRYLLNVNDHSSRNKSYSQFRSNIGLEIHETGIDGLWLHINRFSRTLWDRFADFPAAFDKELSTPWRLVFTEKDIYAELAFYGTDTFVFSSRGIGSAVFLAKPSEHLGEHWFEQRSSDNVLIRGYSKNGDARDPDECTPFLLGIRAVKGSLSEEGELTASAENGDIYLAFSFEALETDADRISEKLAGAPGNSAEAAESCLEDIKEQVSGLDFECNEKEAAIIAKAVNGLTANTVKAPGRLKSHLSAYPSRGYSSHFMWDTCFQNLAYEEMNIKTAKDFLLQFAACQRADGKYEQFLCSTWGRPSYSQPPLTGWAVLRIAEKDFDVSFIETMLPSIEKNTVWWLNNRMTEYGLICCPHGLETGQDDSPRFDGGTTLACDMNSFLLNQMNCTAKLAGMLGEKEKALKWERKAAAFGEKMKKLLWCEEDGVFYDVLPATGEFVKIVSPVSFLPFWAEIDISEEKRSASIEKYLLSPEYLFGDIPFPSVAYNEESYSAGAWWRGPTWMPEAWLMLETLEKTGYRKERLEAAKRLHDMALNDGEMHELFDSSTGKGLGEAEQGWTCAVFMALCRILREET